MQIARFVFRPFCISGIFVLMQHHILWQGIEYLSLEHCQVKSTADGWYATSTIVGFYHQIIYRVRYTIWINPQWETVKLEISNELNSSEELIVLECNDEEAWLLNGKVIEALKGCIDVDIPLTPFTNSLPINRLQLQPGERREIQVIYLYLLSRKLYPVRELYKRLSDTTYHYENVPNDFEAAITVDDRGFVVDYPTLFTRLAMHISDE